MADETTNKAECFTGRIGEQVQIEQEMGAHVLNVSEDLRADEGATIIIQKDGKMSLTMWNEGGYNSTSVDLRDLIALLRRTPELAHLLDESKVPLTSTERYTSPGISLSDGVVLVSEIGAKTCKS